MIVQIILDRTHHCGTHFQNRMLLFRTQPEMPMIKQELRTVFFRSDRKVMRILENLGTRHVNFNASGRARIFAHSTMNNQRRFLTEWFQGFPNFRRDGALHDDALHDAGSIPQLWKHQLPARAQVV